MPLEDIQPGDPIKAADLRETARNALRARSGIQSSRGSTGGIDLTSGSQQTPPDDDIFTGEITSVTVGVPNEYGFKEVWDNDGAWSDRTSGRVADGTTTIAYYIDTALLAVGDICLIRRGALNPYGYAILARIYKAGGGSTTPLIDSGEVSAVSPDVEVATTTNGTVVVTVLDFDGSPWTPAVGSSAGVWSLDGGTTWTAAPFGAASTTNPGWVSTGNQSLAGLKEFTNGIDTPSIISSTSILDIAVNTVDVETDNWILGYPDLFGTTTFDYTTAPGLVTTGGMQTNLSITGGPTGIYKSVGWVTTTGGGFAPILDGTDFRTFFQGWLGAEATYITNHYAQKYWTQNPSGIGIVQGIDNVPSGSPAFSHAEGLLYQVSGALGSIIYYEDSGSVDGYVTLAIGSSGQVLTVSSGRPAWVTPTAPSIPSGGATTITGIFCGNGSTITGRTLTGPAAGITVSNGTGASGNPTLALANDLAALEGMSGTGLVARTASETYAQRTITQPAAGITVSNGDGVAGNPTLALANDLAALEGLGSTGIAVRSAADTWVQRQITSSGGTITITNPAGVAGDINIEATASAVPTGTIVPFAGFTVPTGWLLCDGSAVSRTTYAALFSALSFTISGTTVSGTPFVTVSAPDAAKVAVTQSTQVGCSASNIADGTKVTSVGATQLTLNATASSSATVTLTIRPYGPGDGSTTFNLPDLRRRVPVGAGGTGTTELENRVGSDGGEEDHILTTTEIPSHTHNVANGNQPVAGGVSGTGANVTIGGGGYSLWPTGTTSAGGGGSHNNIQPSIVLNYIIKT